MARPLHDIILRGVDEDDVVHTVAECDGVFSVFYDGRPISYSKKHEIRSELKYPYIHYSNPGHALRRAEQLNEMFSTTSFTVVRLTMGETIT